jgi:hypothetical protein
MLASSGLPGPVVATLTAPGLARASVTTSAQVLKRLSVLTNRPEGWRDSTPSVTRSLAFSVLGVTPMTISVSEVMMPMLWPSAGVCSSRLRPITPVAPGAFSTAIVPPRSLSNQRATMRPTVSAPPPGPQGTIISIGRAGNLSCDQLVVPAAASGDRARP